MTTKTKPKTELAPDGYASGYVVAAVKDRMIVTYYQGDGEWGGEEYAKYGRTVKRSEELRREAKECLPKNATGAVLISCWIPE